MSTWHLAPFVVTPALPQPGASHPGLESTPAMGRSYTFLRLSPHSCPVSCIPSASMLVGVMRSETPKHRSSSWRPRSLAHILRGCTWLVSSLLPPGGAPVFFCSCCISLLPEEQNKSCDLVTIHICTSQKQTEQMPLATGAPQLRAGEMCPEGGSFLSKS